MSAQPTDNQNQGGTGSILQDSASFPPAEGRVVEVESASSQSIPSPPTLSLGPTAGLGGGLARDQSSSAIPELAMAISSSIMSMFQQMQQNATYSFMKRHSCPGYCDC